MRKIYRGRHDFLLSHLTCFEKEFMISGENAGLHILLTSRSKIPESELIAAAAKEGIKLYGISDACMGQRSLKNTSFENTILLGYGSLEEPELRRGLMLLEKAWAPYLCAGTRKENSC